MSLHDAISIAQYLVVGLSLAMLGGMIFRGKLREKHLRLGPTRDLQQPPIIYLVGTLLVMGYAALRLSIGSDPSDAIQVILQVLPVIIIALMVGMMPHIEAGFRTIGLLPRHPLRDTIYGLGGGIICFGLAGAAGMLAAWITTLLGQPVPQVSHETLVVLREAFSVELLLTIVLSAVVMAPLLEELLFRGVLQTSLMRLLKGQRWIAILISAAVFSAIHGWVVPTQALVPLLVLGIAWGYLYERTGSLLAPILAHAVFNAINIAIALTMP